MQNGLGKTVVLLSGGLDSAVVMALELARGRVVVPLFLRYGQRHAREEGSARGIVFHYQGRFPGRVGELLSVGLDHSGELSGGLGRGREGSAYVPARNLLMVSVGAAMAEAHGAQRVALGVTGTGGHPDTLPGFVAAASAAAQKSTKTRVSVTAPLMGMQKFSVVLLGERLGVPMGMTWSCFEGGETPCGKCDACFVRDEAEVEAGVLSWLTLPS